MKKDREISLDTWTWLDTLCCFNVARPRAGSLLHFLRRRRDFAPSFSSVVFFTLDYDGNSDNGNSLKESFQQNEAKLVNCIPPPHTVSPPGDTLCLLGPSLRSK